MKTLIALLASAVLLPAISYAADSDETAFYAKHHPLVSNNVATTQKSATFDAKIIAVQQVISSLTPEERQAMLQLIAANQTVSVK